VDEDSSPSACCLGEIRFNSDGAVRHVLDRKELRLWSGNFNPTDLSASGKEGSASRVGRIESIRRDEIVVETRQERLGRNFPEAVGALSHGGGRLAGFHLELDFLSLFRLHAEGRRQIAVESREFRSRDIRGSR